MALVACLGAAGEWTTWDELFTEVVAHLNSTGFVDPDTARAASMAGDLAREAGERGRSRRAYGIAQRQWRALGRMDEVAKTRKAVASLGRLPLPPEEED